MFTHKHFIEKTARFLKKKKPFFFVVNFDKTQAYTYSFKEAYENNILFNIKGTTNVQTAKNIKKKQISQLTSETISFSDYEESFDKVMYHIKMGNSFLVNLTFPNKIKSSLSLSSIFFRTNASYKLLYNNQFVCFSPECFVKIKDGYIYSYPMKGTLDARLPTSSEILLQNPKEQQEHNTIVDLIRNDISMIAKEVTVTKFRFLEKIENNSGGIWQTSSEIRGKLHKNWQKDFGKMLLNILPAGSICGAPKQKTLEIIEEVENYHRGFYTGIFGVFDGETIDSGVAIRFIEKENDQLWFKSGGGITHQSDAKEEYHELISKIYVPAF